MSEWLFAWSSGPPKAIYIYVKGLSSYINNINQYKYKYFGLEILIWICLPLLLYALHPTPSLACLFFKLWYFFSTCKSLIIFNLTASLISEVFSFMKVSTRFCQALRLVRYSTRPYSAKVENTKNMQPNTHKSIAFMYETWGVNVLDWNKRNYLNTKRSWKQHVGP